MEIKLSRTEVQTISVQTRKRMLGRVRWYDTALCYGFLRSDDGSGEDIFFHKSGIQVPHIRTLRPGQRVLFDYCATPRGKFGMNIIPILEDEQK